MIAALLTTVVLALLPQASAIAPAEAAAYSEALERVELMLQEHPDLVSKRILGKSTQGRELFVLRITRAKSADAVEVYLGSGIHGSEGSQDDGLWMVERLLDRSQRAEVADLLENRILWFQPMVNPDGIAAHQRLSATGVDLNRNFGHQWIEYAQPGEYGHQGAAAFSEPETAAVRDFLLGRKHLRAYVDLHRPASMIIVPEAGRGGRPVAACAEAALALGASMGASFKKGATLLPKGVFANQGGMSIDWVWFHLGVVAFTWELPRDPQRIEAREDPRWRGLLHVLEASAQYPRPERDGAQKPLRYDF